MQINRLEISTVGSTLYHLTFKAGLEKTIVEARWCETNEDLPVLNIKNIKDYVLEEEVRIYPQHGIHFDTLFSIVKSVEKYTNNAKNTKYVFEVPVRYFMLASSPSFKLNGKIIKFVNGKFYHSTK